MKKYLVLTQEESFMVKATTPQDATFLVCKQLTSSFADLSALEKVQSVLNIEEYINMVNRYFPYEPDITLVSEFSDNILYGDYKQSAIIELPSQKQATKE